MKKEFIEGLYPQKKFRDERVDEINKEIEVLTVNLESLNKNLNQLLFELKILENMDNLEKYIEGKIDIRKEEEPPSER